MLNRMKKTQKDIVERILELNNNKIQSGQGIKI